MTKYMNILLALIMIFALPSVVMSCNVTDIRVKTVKAGFVNKCRVSPCMMFRGIAVITNNCKMPVGVEVKLTAYSKDNQPVATFSGWPASTRNIPIGDYEFSLDTWLEYNPAISQYKLSIVDVRQW